MLNIYLKHLERNYVQASFCTSCPPMTHAVYCQAQWVYLTYISAVQQSRTMRWYVQIKRGTMSIQHENTLVRFLAESHMKKLLQLFCLQATINMKLEPGAV